jgi:hypothetical protein
MTRRPLLIVGFLAAATSVSLAVAAPADAARQPKPKVELFSTVATYNDRDGAAVVTGEIEGKPFDGSYVATLAAADGSLPEPGVCEPATVSFHLDGPRRRFVDAEATGDVCGEFVQPPYIVTHSFTGRYDIVDSSRRRIEGTDGFLEVRLGDDGSASTFLIDT